MYVRRDGIILQAFRWTGDPDQDEDPAWAADAMSNGELSFENEGTPKVRLLIHAANGTLCAKRGDWIIRDADGATYPCKPEMFEQIYERLQAVENTRSMATLREIVARVDQALSRLRTMSRDFAMHMGLSRRL